MDDIKALLQTLTSIFMRKQKLRKIISASLLKEEDKELWFKFIRRLNLEQTNFFIDLIQKSPDVFDKLTKNLKKKKEIITSENRELIQSLLEEEENDIEELSKKYDKF